MASSLMQQSDVDSNEYWEDHEVGLMQQVFYNQFIKNKVQKL